MSNRYGVMILRQVNSWSVNGIYIHDDQTPAYEDNRRLAAAETWEEVIQIAQQWVDMCEEMEKDTRE